MDIILVITILVMFTEVLANLLDLDQVSVRKPSLLAPAVSDLCELIQSPSGAVRNQAHGLLSRYLRHMPSAALSVLPAYLSCLHSGQCELVSSLLDRLPEIVICSQGNLFLLFIFRLLFSIDLRGKRDPKNSGLLLGLSGP